MSQFLTDTMFGILIVGMILSIGVAVVAAIVLFGYFINVYPVYTVIMLVVITGVIVGQSS